MDYLMQTLSKINIFNCDICINDNLFKSRPHLNPNRNTINSNPVANLDSLNIESQNPDPQNLDSLNIESQNPDPQNLDSLNIESQNPYLQNLDSLNIESQNPYPHSQNSESHNPNPQDLNLKILPDKVNEKMEEEVIPSIKNISSYPKCPIGKNTKQHSDNIDPDLNNDLKDKESQVHIKKTDSYEQSQEIEDNQLKIKAQSQQQRKKNQAKRKEIIDAQQKSRRSIRQNEN